jgi:hypothetical protein
MRGLRQMTCSNIMQGEQIVGHICRSAGVTRRVLHRRPKRFWCFCCRQRLLHVRMGFYPSGLSYYEPHFWWECPNCHEEHVLFPGREWAE